MVAVPGTPAVQLLQPETLMTLIIATGNYDTSSPAGVSVLAFSVYHHQAFLSFVSDIADLLEL